MKKFGRKGLLGILAIIAALVAMLASAVPVAAAVNADFPIQLIGASSINLSKADMGALLNTANTYTKDTNVFEGVRLQQLIAMVDDGDPDTLNTSLLGTYSIVFTGLNQDGSNYVKTAAAGHWADYFTGGSIETNDVFIATKVQLGGAGDFGDLAATSPDGTKNWRPGIVSGSNIVSSGQRVGGLYKIQLTGLPASSAAVSISPASQAVANSATFSVNLDVNLVNRWSRGWGATVDFDASKMSANGVTEGTFLSDYATAHGGGTVSGGAATIDNIGGHVIIPGYAISGAGASGPTGTGTLCSISFTAKAGVDNIASVTPSAAVISDVLAGSIPGVTLTGGTVIIGTPPLPDLVVLATSTAGAPVDSENYTISYTIKNIGAVAAGASTTSIVIDSGTPIEIVCPALAVGANVTQTTPVQTLVGTADSVLIMTDSESDVSESNESNNTRSTSYSYAPPQPGDVPVTGTTQTILTFIIPDPVSWDPLNIGGNSANRTMTVTSNENWQVTVLGTNDGFMTKYNGTTYDPAIHLHDALYLMCQNNVTLTGALQILASGTPADQPLGGSGDTRLVIFYQQVYYTDPALTSGFYYQVVVTFTASPTI